MSRRIDVGYVPLLDAAPLIIAAEMGFAAEEGLDLALHREMSWAALRDRLIWGRYAAAHMLAPVVIAQTAGIGVGDAALDALMVLSVNGDMIGAGPALAGAVAAAGGDFLDAAATGRALAAATAERPLRFGVPFPLSMHAALVDYWLAGSGLARRGQPRHRAAAADGGGDGRWRDRRLLRRRALGQRRGRDRRRPPDPARRGDLAVRAREGPRHAARGRRRRARTRRAR